MLALLLAASLAGAGCSGNDNPSVADTGVGDIGKTDGSMVEDTGTTPDTGTTTDTGTDTGTTTDTGVIDGGGMTDAGDSGTPVDSGGGDSGTTDGGTTDGGATGHPHRGSSIVSAGSLMRSSRFQMISTLGGRSVQQTTLQSPNFRLRGGLVGTIGAR